MRTNSKKDLRDAKYSLRQDVLTIEFNDSVVFVKFVYSQYQPQRIHTFAIQTMRKDRLENFGVLSSKNSLGTCFSSHELCVFRHEGGQYLDSNLPMDTGEIIRYLKLQPLVVGIKGVCRVRYNIRNITDLSTFGPKSKVWDYAISFAGSEQDYFALIQDGIKYNSRDKFQADAASKVMLFDDYSKPEESMEASLIVMVNQNNQPSYLKLTSDDRFVEVPAHEASVPLIFDAHEKALATYTIRDSRISCQVNKSSILLRSDESDLKVPLKVDCLSSSLYHYFLLVLGNNLTLTAYAIYKQEGKIKCTEIENLFQSSSELLQGKVTAFSIDKELITIATTSQQIFIFTVFVSDSTMVLCLLFTSSFILGSVILKNTLQAIQREGVQSKPGVILATPIKNELDDLQAGKRKQSQSDMLNLSQPWASITDPSWKMSFPLIFNYNQLATNVWHTVVDSIIYIMIQLRNSELLVYRSMSMDKDIMKLKRLALNLPLNVRLSTDDDKDDVSEMSTQVVADLIVNKAYHIATMAINKQLVLFSATNARTSIIVFCKGEAYLHPLKGISEERVMRMTDGSVLFKDNEGKLTLRRLYEPLNYCIEHQFPFVSYSLEEKIIQLIAVEKDGCCGLVLVCKKFNSDEYRLLLFDVSACVYTDELKFSQGDKVSNVKKLCLENRNFEVEDTLCLMYVQQGQGILTGLYSKWRLVRFAAKAQAETGKKSLKFDAREEYTEQETNEIITSAFNIGETLFLTIDKRIVQMKPSGGYKVERTYYPNTSYIVDSCVNNNSVIITNVKGNIIFMIWMKDQNRLVQKTESLLCNSFLYESKFLDNRQTKMVCSDAEGSIHLVKVYTDTLSDDKEDITLKITKLQRVKLPSKVVSMDSLKSSPGLILAMSNGGIMTLSPSLVKQSADDIHDLHELMSVELPFPAGLNPFTSFYYKAGSDLHKMEKRELYDSDLLNLFGYLSLPWQSKLATSLDRGRTDLASILLETLHDKQ